MGAYSVTLAGPERHDAEAPYSWVVEAETVEAAITTAVAVMASEINSDDIVFVGIEAGVPAADCGYCWNDLRRNH
jgi:uncharacterized protein (UPF0212 family)